MVTVLFPQKSSFHFYPVLLSWFSEGMVPPDVGASIQMIPQGHKSTTSEPYLALGGG
jgi:hypothetical protein